MPDFNSMTELNIGLFMFLCKVTAFLLKCKNALIFIDVCAKILIIKLRRQ